MPYHKSAKRPRCEPFIYHLFDLLEQCFFSLSVLGHIAIPYYEKVLEMEPTGDNAEQKKVSICP